MSRWYRIHFRNGKNIIVEGEAERDRIVARKVPKAILVENAKTYSCGECGKVAAWTKDWRWYGSWRDIEDGKPVLHLCGDDCQERFALQHPQKRRPKVSQRAEARLVAYEPADGDRNYYAIYKARLNANPRRFPMPEHPTIPGLGKREGQCRWCGEKILSAYAWQRSWHTSEKGDSRDCKREWLLHTDLATQTDYLIQRDGPGCALLGRREGRWIAAYSFPDWTRIQWSEQLQVDHVIPLWEVAHLPPAERRLYFGPGNLWLLSDQAHKRKTALEAAQRAQMRRND